MKKKGISMVIVIPMAALMMAIIGVFAYKLYSEGTRTKAAEPAVIPKTLPSLKTTGNKPKNSYGTLAAPTSTVTPIPTAGAVIPIKDVDIGEIATSSSPAVNFTSVDNAISGL